MPVSSLEKPAHTESDRLLWRFLNASQPQQIKRELEYLLEKEVQPLLRAQLWKRMRGGTGDTDRDVEDLVCDAQAAVLEKLYALHARECLPIRSLRGYVRQVAQNSWHRLLRDRYPRRAALSDRVLYLIGKGIGFARWEGAEGETLAGFEAWAREGKNALVSRPLSLLTQSPLQAWEAAAPMYGSDTRQLPEIMAALFNWLGHPIEIDLLINSLAVILHVQDAPAASLDDEQQSLFQPADSVSTEREAESRLFLQSVWREMGSLSLAERMALLLNLRDTEGRGIIALFPITGIAALTDIAALLEMPPAKLAALWEKLPLDDNSIAQMQGVTRQFVINRRKEAHRKLARKICFAE